MYEKCLIRISWYGYSNGGGGGGVVEAAKSETRGDIYGKAVV